MIDSEFQAEPTAQPPDFPWPPRADDSALEALATTWRESVFQPTSFFRRMPRGSQIGWVLLYYLMIGVVVAGISLFWQMLLGPSLIERWLWPDPAPAGSPVVDFLLSPVWLLMGLYAAAGGVHLMLLLVRGGRHGFGPTLRVFCFASGPQLFSVVPYVGPVIGGVWSLVITVIGLREAHETTTGKAAAAILIPLVLLLGVAVVVFVVAALLGLSGLAV